MPKQAPKRWCLDNTSEAACQKQAPKRRSLDNTSGAACPEQAPKRRCLDNQGRSDTGIIIFDPRITLVKGLEGIYRG